MPISRCLFVVLALIVLPVSAARHFEGELPGASGRYAIDVPDGWQPGGRLIVYSHGFSMRFPSPTLQVETAPNAESRAYFMGRGYALAAASYSSRGWALFDIEREQQALLAEFRRRVGGPGEIVLFGGSLGGLVSMKTAEAYSAAGEPVGGVLALCPPLAGARSWDFAVDTRLLFDAVCESSPLPEGSAALPWVLDYSAIPPNLSDLPDGVTLESVLPIANRVRQCMGFYQPSIFDTSAQLQRRAQLKALLGITSDDFLLTNIAYAIYPLADLIQGPDKLAGFNAFDNRFVDYGDPAINARVRRVAGDPIAAAKLRAASNLRGPYGNARVLVIPTNRDELVIPEHIEVLSELGIPPEQLSVALIRQSQPAHCDFSASELLAGFESLRNWIDGGPQPNAAGLRAHCLARSGLSGDRCGYDPSITLSSLDQRIRPRQLEPRPISSRHTGSWFDPQFDGEGLLIEIINGGRDAVVGWYTYPPVGGEGEQRWIVGLGRVTQEGIHVAEAFEYRGARFGDFDPTDIQTHRFGELTLAFGGCDLPPASGQTLPAGQLRLRYQGSSAYGSGERVLNQLTQNAVSFPLCAEVGIPPLPEPSSSYAGSWYRASGAGDGWLLQIGSDRRAVVGWYTFDPQGRAAWLIGTGLFDPANRRVTFTMQRTRGARFGSAFRPADVQRIDWGDLTLSFDSCGSGRAQWTARESGWTSGSEVIARLTKADGTPGCEE
ncbi:MAG: hypothetical protein ACT4NL_15200 [Pseudomarimonas sp.]